MLHLRIETDGAGGAVQVAGDDVPPDPANREMIKRRHATANKNGALFARLQVTSKPRCVVA
jgi:hypothetical protein